MNRKYRLFTMMALTALAMTSCKKDYFDEDVYEQRVRDNFPVTNVDPQHTWATTGSASVSLSVDLTQGETYAVRIYDQSPISSPSGLSLLGEGSVSSGQTLSTSISYPLYLDYVYVALFDHEGYMTVYPQGVDNGGTVKLQVGSAQTASSQSRRIITYGGGSSSESRRAFWACAVMRWASSIR